VFVRPALTKKCHNDRVAKIWVERLEGSGVPIDYWGHIPTSDDGAGNLIPGNMMMVAVASFTFRFVSTDQLKDCLDYYQRKTHPSSMCPIGAMGHWDAQRWFERLPMYLLEAPKRAKVVNALKRALAIAEAGAFSDPKP